ncbi:MAG TPA: hypothetical protein VMW85_01890 [Methanomassiliicoccales archaeon]|nr:hypothetical protein [Methanomassiliicoccales archaeon]
MSDQTMDGKVLNGEVPARVLCLGGGRICAKVLGQLLSEDYRVAVLDADEHCLVADRCRVCGSIDELWYEAKPLLLCGDVISTAVAVLEKGSVDLLVPGMPGHTAGRLAMAWGGGGLSPRGSSFLEKKLVARLGGLGNVTMDPDNGTVLMTLNKGSKKCPEDCEQKEICPLTGHSLVANLYQVLKAVLDDMSIGHAVLRTIKVDAYGAILGKDLKSLRNLVKSSEVGDIIAVATCCPCHAVMNLFKVCRTPSVLLVDGVQPRQ